MPVVVSGNKININWVKGGWIGDGSQIFSVFGIVGIGWKARTKAPCFAAVEFTNKWPTSLLHLHLQLQKPPNSYTNKGILHADDAFNTNLGPITHPFLL